MPGKPQKVIVPIATGRRWWEVPDALWRRLAGIRTRRLRQTVAKHVLPLLRELESLYLEQNPGAVSRLAGKSMDAIEFDDAAIEAGLHLFDLAIGEGLIAFEGRKGVAGGTPVLGSCAMSLAEVRAYYMGNAVLAIIAKRGHDAVALKKLLGKGALVGVGQLRRVRLLAELEPAIIEELRLGLNGTLEPLMSVDEDYLRVLAGCDPQRLLRILRTSLGKQFKGILAWPPEFLGTVNEALDHPAKIAALGPDLLAISDPEVVRAICAWQVKEVVARKSGGIEETRIVTRIEQFRKVVGPHLFRALLTSNAGVVAQAGQWPNDHLEHMKHFFGCLSFETAETLGTMPAEQQTGLMDGLWERFGREYLAVILAHESGVRMVQGVVDEIKSMGDSHSKDAVKSLVVGELFAKHFLGLPAQPAGAN